LGGQLDRHIMLLWQPAIVLLLLCCAILSWFGKNKFSRHASVRTSPESVPSSGASQLLLYFSYMYVVHLAPAYIAHSSSYITRRTSKHPPGSLHSSQTNQVSLKRTVCNVLRKRFCACRPTSSTRIHADLARSAFCKMGSAIGHVSHNFRTTGTLHKGQELLYSVLRCGRLYTYHAVE